MISFWFHEVWNADSFKMVVLTLSPRGGERIQREEILKSGKADPNRQNRFRTVG